MKRFQTLPFIAIAIAAVIAAPATAADDAEPSSKGEYETLSLRGRVVYAGEAMQRLHGVSLVSEAEEKLLVLETSEGELHPILEDLRGRAFRKDQRLMGVDTELLVRRYRGTPLIQVIKLHHFRDGQKFVVDYWCEICAIAMYELKPCDCCQGDIDLRLRPAEDDE